MTTCINLICLWKLRKVQRQLSSRSWGSNQPSFCSWIRNIARYVSEMSSGPVSNELRLNHCRPIFLMVNQWSLKLHIKAFSRLRKKLWYVNEKWNTFSLLKWLDNGLNQHIHWMPFFLALLGKFHFKRTNQDINAHAADVQYYHSIDCLAFLNYLAAFQDNKY